MKKIGFIGMGNMAGAILLGALANGYLKDDEVVVYDINPSQLSKLDEYDIAIAKNEEELVDNSEMVFVGVKPQVIENVILPLKENLKNKALISIVLGYDFDKYKQLLDESTRHIFVMPNTPAMVGEGMSLIEKKHSLTEKEFNFVKGMFSAIGEIEILPSHLMGVGGALSGCGPAYIYMVIEALADGAVLEGMPRDLAYKLASQTVLGAGKMQRETKLHPGVLKDNVCSPGGTTIQGVSILEKGKMRSLFMDAVSKGIRK